MIENRAPSTTQSLFLQMLEYIQTGEWSIGSAIPSESMMIDQFGVSRLSIREAVSMLRGLGVVEVSHGRRTRVREFDIRILDRLLPLMLSSGGQRTFEQVYEMRLAIEPASAALAAVNRSDKQMCEIEALVQEFGTQTAASSPKALKTDLAFHQHIAHATGNPLFPIMIEALSRFVVWQLESSQNDQERRDRAVLAHQAIAEAIADRDSVRARLEMESHLRYNAARVLDAIKLDLDYARSN